MIAVILRIYRKQLSKGYNQQYIKLINWNKFQGIMLEQKFYNLESAVVILLLYQKNVMYFYKINKFVF